MNRHVLGLSLGLAAFASTSPASAYYCEYPANPTQRGAYRECIERQRVAKEREKEMRDRQIESGRALERQQRERENRRYNRY